MGLLVEGRWVDDWYQPDGEGRFVRPDAMFRGRVCSDDSTPFAAEAGRYHLYVSLACPWAHRTLIVRRLRGLERAIGLTIVQPRMGAEGWEISGDGVFADPNLGASRLFEVYRAADETFTGRVTVPVLWDKQTGTIVNNESREILRMLSTVFTPIAEHPDVNFWTPELSDAIDAMIDANYETVNNGVYRSGFATSQTAYEEAASAVFMRLDELDALLGTRRYLCGDRITEADWCLFATLVRFDPVYHGHFKCNLRRVRDYPNLSGYVRELYQVPGVRATVDFDHIQTHYYWSHESINPTRIVPIGGRDDLDAPHGRDAL